MVTRGSYGPLRYAQAVYTKKVEEATKSIKGRELEGDPLPTIKRVWFSGDVVNVAVGRITLGFPVFTEDGGPSPQLLQLLGVRASEIESTEELVSTLKGMQLDESTIHELESISNTECSTQTNR